MATTFCHMHCDRLGQKTQSTPWPLTLINPGLECRIQGVAIWVPCCVKASLLLHPLSSPPVFRSSQLISGGFLKPQDDRMVPDYHLLVRRNIHVRQSCDEMQLSVFTVQVLRQIN